MEIFSGPWFWALLTIILMDLVLAGDNAIVIALAARNLPHKLQRKAILWGTAGAIIIRVLMTLVVAWLLDIPGLKLLGGLGLIWIAVKLLKPHDFDTEHLEADGKIKAEMGFIQAIKTIVIADALMGLDNVLAIAGAAKGNLDLIVIGLLISIPIVVFGSTLVLKLMERFNWIIYVGAAVLAYTAVAMVASEALVAPYLAHIPTVVLYIGKVILIIGIVMSSKLIYRKKAPVDKQA